MAIRITVAAVVLALAPALAPAQSLGTYDTFSSALLDPVKWRGFESIQSNTLGVRDAEISRTVGDGQFRASLRTYGATGVDFGVSGSARNRIHIVHPSLTDHQPRITVLQAKVTPKAAEAQDCPINTSETRARAVVMAFFFNDGTGNATANDRTGDIIAGVQLERHSKLGNRIVGFIARCDQASCGDAQTIKFVTFEQSWAFNAQKTVTVLWRPSTDDFQFTVGAEAQTVTYDDVLLQDTEAPKDFFYTVGVQNTVANCVGERLEAFFDSQFDNVRINATAVNALGP
jgi:hypothetical protein